MRTRIAAAITLILALVGFGCLLAVAHLATVPVLILATIGAICLALAATEVT